MRCSSWFKWTKACLSSTPCPCRGLLSCHLPAVAWRQSLLSTRTAAGPLLGRSGLSGLNRWCRAGRRLWPQWWHRWTWSWESSGGGVAQERRLSTALLTTPCPPPWNLWSHPESLEAGWWFAGVTLGGRCCHPRWTRTHSSTGLAAPWGHNPLLCKPWCWEMMKSAPSTLGLGL